MTPPWPGPDDDPDDPGDLFTGLSGLWCSWPEFAAYRFLCGMGMGGEYAVGVALVAETMPERARPFALGLVQGSPRWGRSSDRDSACRRTYTTFGQTAGWRVLFWFGLIPSLLVVLIRMRVREPDRWLRARELALLVSRSSPAASPCGLGHAAGGPCAIFGDHTLRRRTLVGMTLGMVGQVGLWSIGLFMPSWCAAACWPIGKTNLPALSPGTRESISW